MRWRIRNGVIFSMRYGTERWQKWRCYLNRTAHYFWTPHFLIMQHMGFEFRSLPPPPHYHHHYHDHHLFDFIHSFIHSFICDMMMMITIKWGRGWPWSRWWSWLWLWWSELFNNLMMMIMSIHFNYMMMIMMMRRRRRSRMRYHNYQ